MSTQDDDLRLEPPQSQPSPPRPEVPAEPAPGGGEVGGVPGEAGGGGSPQPPAPTPPPPAPVYSPPGQPAPVPPAEADSGLEPGAGRPLVEGPPMSVGAPVSDAAINRTAAFFGIGLLGVGAIVALVLLLVIVFAVCHH